MRPLAFALAAVLTPATVACGSSTQATPRPSSVAGCRETITAPGYGRAIDTARPLVRRLRAGIRAPGMSLAVAAGGKIVWSIECGYADVKSHRPVSFHTRFRIGSISKPLTATALAHYAETGRVDLDAPINRYLPDFPTHSDGITLRRLAGHLAGIRHYQNQAEAVNRRHFDSVEASLALFANDPLVATPGSRFAYSSYGYDVIGAALERATNLKFSALMRQAVLTPAAMRETTLATAAPAQRATFYELTNSGRIRIAPPIDLSDRLPAGGFLSTARDLARWGVALSGGELVKAATLKLMFTSQKTTSGEATGYGLGFEVHPSPLGLFVGHTGAVDGGTAALVIHPQSGIVLALATNLGYATAKSPPPPKKGTPDPPQVLLPFIRK